MYGILIVSYIFSLNEKRDNGMKRMKKNIMLLAVLLVVLISIFDMTAIAGTISSSKTTSSNVKSVKIKQNYTVKIKQEHSVIKFKAPKKGKYIFNLSNAKFPSDMADLGFLQFYIATYDTVKKDYFPVAITGFKKAPLFAVSDKDFWLLNKTTYNHYKSEIPSNITTNKAGVMLEKGQTVYLYITVPEANYPASFKLNIKIK